MGKHHDEPSQLSPEQMRRLGQTVAGLAVVGMNQGRRLQRLAEAHAQRCARVVALRRELRAARAQIDELQRKLASSNSQQATLERRMAEHEAAQRFATLYGGG